MAAGGSVEVVGLKDFRRAVRKADRGVDKTMRESLKKSAAPMLAKAQGYAAAVNESGQLAGRASTFATQKAVGFRFRAPYAGVHEFGVKFRRTRAGRTHEVDYSRHPLGAPPRFAFRARDEMLPEARARLVLAVRQVMGAEGWLD